MSRRRRRSEAESQLAELRDNAGFVNVIHYSCESFYNRTDGLSSKIATIAVSSLVDAQTHTFAIHQIAERQGVALEDIPKNYDHLECILLEEFFNFVRLHRKHKWLHWNMRDSNYGFPALAHRYRVFGGDPIILHNKDLYDLSRLMYSKYGPDYIGDPRLQSLAKLNGMTSRNFLSGAEEAQAFEEGQYNRLYLSTLKKVSVLIDIFERDADGTLKTKAKRFKQLGGDVVALVQVATDSWWFRLLGAIAIIVTLITAGKAGADLILRLLS